MMLRTETFRGRLDALGASWGVAPGQTERQIVRDFGDPDAEYRAMRHEGAGLVDLSDRDTLVITGDDSVPWLQGLVTNDLLALAEEGSGQRTCIVNVNGRLIAAPRLLHVPEMLVVELGAGLAAEVVAHLRHHVITEDVRLADRSAATARLGIFGPAAAEALDALAELERPAAELADYAGTWGAIGTAGAIVQHVPWTGGTGLLLSVDRQDAAAVWDALAADARVRPAGQDTLEMLRIEAGVARYGVELDAKIIPLEAGLDDSINFNKGCYLGQEIIARLDSRGQPAKLLRTLVFEGGAAPRSGAEIVHEGKSVGEVRAAVWSPLAGAPIALGYVKRKHNALGTHVEVDGRQARVERLGWALAHRSGG